MCKADAGREPLPLGQLAGGQEIKRVNQNTDVSV